VNIFGYFVVLFRRKEGFIMKKFICGLIIGFILATSTAALAGQSLRLIVNGADITSQAQPVLIDGRVLVPARALAEKLGAKVEWDAAENTVIVTNSSTIPSMAITSNFTKSGAQTIPYEELERYPDKYKNSKVTYSGEVGLVIEEGENVCLLVNVTKKEFWYQDTILVVYNKNIIPGRVLKKDIITFWGTSFGIHTYTGASGLQVQVPLVKAEIIEIH
jgi:hypothetical protein